MANAKAPKEGTDNKKNAHGTAKICENMTYAAREAFKRLRTNVMISLGDGLEENQEKKCHVIGVTSAQPSEGKSTISINLSYSLAEMGKSVLLVDGDMRRPSLHAALGVEIAPGLTDVLTTRDDPHSVAVIYRSSADDTAFDVIPRGEQTEKPAELLNSARFQKFIETVSKAYDYVVIDLPPVNAVVDAVAVSKSTDGLIVVIREDHCPRDVLVSCVDQLKYAKANILGFVMNGCMEGKGKYYNKYGRKYYQYGNKYSYYYGK